MPTTLPPPPTDSEQGSYIWEDWYNKLRRAVESPVSVNEITLSSTGYIRGGQTSYNVGTGFFLGYESAAYRFSIGNPAGQHITWDGSSLVVNGTLAPNIVTISSILAGAVTELAIAAGAVSASKTAIAAIDSSSGNLTANSVAATNIQADAVTASKILAGSVTSDKITVNYLSAISADMGTITAGNINGVIITGSLFRTATSGRRTEIDDDGMTLFSGNAPNSYNTAGQTYNTVARTYGSGVLAYVNNTSVTTVPFYINEEQGVGDFHYFNRGADPTGVATIGDTAVVGGKLKICTVAGTPGTWTVVGTQV